MWTARRLGRPAHVPPPGHLTNVDCIRRASSPKFRPKPQPRSLQHSLCFAVCFSLGRHGHGTKLSYPDETWPPLAGGTWAAVTPPPPLYKPRPCPSYSRVRNPADRPLGVHHSGRHGGWFYFRLGGACQFNPVPTEGREGDLTYPDELWRRLRRRIRGRAVALRWTDGTMFAAAPPRDTC